MEDDERTLDERALILSRAKARAEIDRWLDCGKCMKSAEVDAVRRLLQLRHGEAVTGVTLSVTWFAISIALGAALGAAGANPLTISLIVLLGLVSLGFLLVSSSYLNGDAKRLTRLEVEFLSRGSADQPVAAN